jgi:hypothetical protein
VGIAPLLIWTFNVRHAHEHIQKYFASGKEETAEVGNQLILVIQLRVPSL